MRRFWAWRLNSLSLPGESRSMAAALFRWRKSRPQPTAGLVISDGITEFRKCDSPGIGLFRLPQLGFASWGVSSRPTGSFQRVLPHNIFKTFHRCFHLVIHDSNPPFYSKYTKEGVSCHIGTGGEQQRIGCRVAGQGGVAGDGQALNSSSQRVRRCFMGMPLFANGVRE